MKIYLKQIVFIILAVFVISCKSKGQEQISGISENNYQKPDTVKEKKITLLFLGDIMEHKLQIESAYNTKIGDYDFSSQFKHLKPLFAKMDAVVGNFEVTLSGPPYNGYPQFSSPDKMAVAVKEAGINYLVMANNHINDRSQYGFERTLRIIDSLGFVRTGAFYNQDDKKKNHPMIIEKNGLKIAVFNYTYNLNNDTLLGDNNVNIFDKYFIQKDLKEADGKGYDAKIVFFHWGTEYLREADSIQQDLAKFCFDNGVDLIIGSHPHVIQPMEYYDYQLPDGTTKKVFVAYSLGNYVSNYGTWRYCDGGAMVQLTLVKKDNKIEIIEPKYHLIWVYRQPRNDGFKNFFVVPVKDYEKNTSIGADNYKLLQTFINDSRELLKQNNINVPEN